MGDVVKGEWLPDRPDIKPVLDALAVLQEAISVYMATPVKSISKSYDPWDVRALAFTELMASIQRAILASRNL